jgi:hypothetical protein
MQTVVFTKNIMDEETQVPYYNGQKETLQPDKAEKFVAEGYAVSADKDEPVEDGEE